MDVKFNTYNIGLTEANAGADYSLSSLENHKLTRLDKPDMITYSGHGQLEVYPAGMSIAYVVSHELRHAQHNRLEALTKDYALSQSIEYSIAFRDGKLIATGGTAKAQFKDAPNIDISVDNKQNILSGLIYYEGRLMSHKYFLEEKRRDMETRLSSLEEKNSILVNPDKDPKISEAYDAKTILEKLDIKLRLHLVKKELDELKREETELAIKKRFELDEIDIDKRDNDDDDKDKEDNSIRLKHEDYTNERNQSKIVMESFRYIKDKRPPVELLDEGSSALRVENTITEIENSRARSVLKDDIRLDIRFISSKIGAYNRLSDLLIKLLNSITPLINNSDGFNIFKASSEDETIVNAIPTVKSQIGSANITISQLAQFHRITSDVHRDPYKALNLSGTIQVNGYDVSITTQDSLNTIRDKINFGEDINKNKTLDLAEDLNGNNQLDILIVTGDNGIVIFEDIDHDRVIDSSEDSNKNDVIDGGTKQIGVLAEITNSQLILTSIIPGDKIKLTEGNGVLEALGFITTDSFNNQVLKHELVTADSTFLSNINPQDSIFSINGKRHTDNSNTILDGIPGTILELKNTSQDNVQIDIGLDVAPIVGRIKAFIEDYNNVIIFLNEQIGKEESLLRDEIPASKIRNRLTKSTTREAKVDDNKINKIKDVGIKELNREKDVYSEVTILNLFNRLKSNMKDSLSIPSKGSNSVINKLDYIGIRSVKDNILIMDEEKIRDSLVGNYKAVKNLLINKDSGILPVLEGEILKFIEDFTGVIQLQITALSSAGISKVINKVRGNNGVIQKGELNTQDRSNILSTI